MTELFIYLEKKNTRAHCNNTYEDVIYEFQLCRHQILLTNSRFVAIIDREKIIVLHS